MVFRSSLAFLKRGVPPPSSPHRCFRSQAALDALRPPSITAGDSSSPSAAAIRSHLVLYNYPSFSGAFAALYAHLFHSRLRLPFLVLPFSSVEPFRVEDFEARAFETCYLLDFVGPKRFAIELSHIVPRVIAFDHREISLGTTLHERERPDNLELHIDTEKCSARSVYDYFSKKFSERNSSQDDAENLLNQEQEERVASVLSYIEDAALCQWRMPDTKAFDIGLRDERAKLNCITNPYVFQQLLQLNSADLIAKGNLYTRSREDAASKLLEKALKIQLGRGFYGECLAVRADGNEDLSHEICIELSRRSAAAGLRPIGAAVFMKQRNLKMCLRTTDPTVDISEIAKAYGGGGKRSSSSFIIRMDEYNCWSAANS
ncbi:uncharacterized protein LOC122037411 [Zingiber officinale]|uniref:Uncharacterized protein n=1 Tax=Zingiber officinale TaxID=94328 RepID=A0A8J5C3I6_ZINOF|nr:uncharacterized protein LOC122006926 [Zingiber officinale]XP_042452815.1 uncharacterized protein LOC122037411 [Zingiber officinale]KAG6466047.1 hypothetical protein ZIOFF_076150 [Zingiber officinale]KAG6490995.1 hypothetical protein ZIOFF_052327 [Zingiber officinale]